MNQHIKYAHSLELETQFLKREKKCKRSIPDCTTVPAEGSGIWNESVIFMEMSRKFEPCFFNWKVKKSLSLGKGVKLNGQNSLSWPETFLWRPPKEETYYISLEITLINGFLCNINAMYSDLIRSVQNRFTFHVDILIFSIYLSQSNILINKDKLRIKK